LAQYPSHPKSPESPISKDHPKKEDINPTEEPEQKGHPNSKASPKVGAQGAVRGAASSKQEVHKTLGGGEKMDKR